MTAIARKIWLCGQQYTRCTSEFGGLLCAHEQGHDGKHHSSWQYWTTSEATAAAGRCEACGRLTSLKCYDCPGRRA